MLELGHALFAVCKTNRTSDVIVDREVRVFGKLGVQLGCVLLYLQHGPRSREGWYVAGCVPGGTFGQFIALKEQHVGAAHLCKVVQGTHARNAAADNDNPCALTHIYVPDFVSSGPSLGRPVRDISRRDILDKQLFDANLSQ